jgi:hypothetical protein
MNTFTTKYGATLTLAAPGIAMDQPVKIVGREDANGKVWLTYNRPDYLQQRQDSRCVERCKVPLQEVVLYPLTESDRFSFHAEPAQPANCKLRY